MNLFADTDSEETACQSIEKKMRKIMESEDAAKSMTVEGLVKSFDKNSDAEHNAEIDENSKDFPHTDHDLMKAPRHFETKRANLLPRLSGIFQEDSGSPMKRSCKMLPHHTLYSETQSELNMPSGQYMHPMQLSNERSPVSQPQLSAMMDPQAPSPELTNRNCEKSGPNLSKTFGNKHSMSATSIQSPSAHGIIVDHTADENKPSDTKDFAEALLSCEYEILREQLSSLPAAKQAGKFTHQVAISVEALFKCFEKEKKKRFLIFEESQASAENKLGALHKALSTELQYLNDQYQAAVDQRLAKLSAVLDEVKTSQEELAKFKHLLRSLTAEFTTEQ